MSVVYVKCDFSTLTFVTNKTVVSVEAVVFVAVVKTVVNVQIFVVAAVIPAIQIVADVADTIHK